MRTLKKTLALVLCLAMIAGLCCIGTSAAFADAADIEYTEAVEVMNGLSVLKGDGTNFNPKGVLTRAEAAVMLAKLIGEGDLKATSSYKDMKGYEWAQNFAAVCEAKGFILGDGKGNFFPGQTLTGYQFGLMLCRALGYKPAQEGVESATYEIGTAALMKKIKLSDAIEGFDGTAALTREQAAALLLKAATLNTVTYGGGSYIEVAPGGTTTIRFNEEGVAGSTGTTLFETVFGGKTWSGVVAANAANTANLPYTTVAGKNFNIATGADLYGHYVTVYYKSEYQTPAKPGVAYAVVDKTITVSGIAPTATAKDVQAAFIAAGFAPATAYTFSDVYQNGTDTNTPVTVTVGTTTGSIASAKTFYAYYDVTTNTNIPYGYAVADGQTLSKVTAINTKAGYETITLAGGSPLNNTALNDEVNEYEGIAVGDLVVYTNLNGVYNLTKVTTVEGKVSKAVLTSGLQSITLENGQTYKQGPAFSTGVALNAAGATGTALASVAMGQSYVLYLDAQGNFVSILGSAAAEAGVMYLTGKYTKTVETAYGSVPTYFAQGVDTTGAEVTYQVTSTEYAKLCEAAGGSNKPAKLLYNVTTAYDPTVKATVATLTAATDAGLVVVDNDRTVAEINALSTKKLGNNYFDANTMFIYVTGSNATLKVSTKTGIQNTAANSYVYYAVKPVAASSNATIKYVFVDAAGSTATAGTGYIYVAANQNNNNMVSYTDVTGAPATGYMVKGFVDGVETDMMVANGSAITTGFYKYTVEAANDLYTLTRYSESNVITGAKIDNFYNGMLTANNGLGGYHFRDMKADNVVVVNAVAKTEANYAYISTDLATIVAETNDGDGRDYTVAIVTDTTGLVPVVTYVYVTASNVTAAD